jgi:hypothetical protein
MAPAREKHAQAKEKEMDLDCHWHRHSRRADFAGYPHQVGNSPTAWNLTGYCWAWLTYPNDAALAQRDRFIVKNLAPLESTR